MLNEQSQLSDGSEADTEKVDHRSLQQTFSASYLRHAQWSVDRKVCKTYTFLPLDYLLLFL